MMWQVSAPISLRSSDGLHLTVTDTDSCLPEPPSWESAKFPFAERSAGPRPFAHLGTPTEEPSLAWEEGEKREEEKERKKERKRKIKKSETTQLLTAAQAIAATAAINLYPQFKNNDKNVKVHTTDRWNVSLLSFS